MSKPKLTKGSDVPVELIKELLTESEWRMVKQRLYIIELLEEGLTVREVAKRAEVGTDTVVRMSKKLAQSKLLQSIFRKSKQQLPKWIFGQVSGEKD